ncbi:unnamed protein product [Mytilus edulis]|uniref:Uncharacterized protein n=1 Tax=Mytilus edulis TaxID=6550 RepID=A0A8S3VC55_MYTED|nr:unnamed protein product [Mytilus edulis]
MVHVLNRSSYPWDLAYNNLAILPGDVFRNSVALEYVMCTTCLDCDCLSASTYQWIKHIVIDNNVYEFTCHNGVVLPNTVFNCSDDGSRLAVTSIENGSSCNCKDSITKQLSSMDVTIETTPAIESTKLDSSYTYTAGIISGMVASLTLIITYTALKRIIHTMSRIKHSDITDNEINKTINDGFDFIPTVYGEMAKKYNNIPPKSHINTIDNGIDVLKTLNYNEQMNKEYDNIPPKSHITLSSFSNMSNVHHTMVLEGIQPVEACDIFYVETFPNSTLVHKTCV